MGHAHTGMPQQLELLQGTPASLVPTGGERSGRGKDGGEFGLGVLLGGRMLGHLLYPWLPFVFLTEVLCWQVSLSSR